MPTPDDAPRQLIAVALSLDSTAELELLLAVCRDRERIWTEVSTTIANILNATLQQGGCDDRKEKRRPH